MGCLWLAHTGVIAMPQRKELQCNRDTFSEQFSFIPGRIDCQCGFFDINRRALDQLQAAYAET